MKIILETQLHNMDEAKTLQELLNEMGYKTYRYVKYHADDERKTPVSETRLGRIILGYAASQFGDKVFCASNLDETLLLHGYKPVSATPILSALVVEGKIQRVNRGEYSLITEGGDLGL